MADQPVDGMAADKTTGAAIMAKPADTSMEKATDEASAFPTANSPADPVRLKTGSFRDADLTHRGSGTVNIYRGPDGSHLLRLENLNVTNGPDLRVILTPHPNPMIRGDVKVPGYVDLGKLKGNMGNQNYVIPSDVDPAAYGSVVIYCKPFQVIFSVASLQKVG